MADKRVGRKAGRQTRKTILRSMDGLSQKPRNRAWGQENHTEISELIFLAGLKHCSIVLRLALGVFNRPISRKGRQSMIPSGIKVSDLAEFAARGRREKEYVDGWLLGWKSGGRTVAAAALIEWPTFEACSDLLD